MDTTELVTVIYDKDTDQLEFEQVKPQIYELLKELNAEESLLIKELGYINYTPKPVNAKHRLSLNNNNGIVILQFNGNVVATLSYLKFSDYNETGFYIYDLVVSSNYRNRGLATKLLEEAKVHAKALGCSNITLSHYVNNIPATKLYQKLGFSNLVSRVGLRLDTL